MTAGAAWWVGLLCWRWFRTDAVPIPGLAAVPAPFDALDPVTLPTLVAAPAYAAVRSRHERAVEGHTGG